MNLPTTFNRLLACAILSALTLLCAISTKPCYAAEEDGKAPGAADDLQESPVEKAKIGKAKRVIGAVAKVEEKQSDLVFSARVDTGATTSSIHVEQWKIADKAEKMTKNLGKNIRFQIKNDDGKSKWLERKIEAISVIKTSEREEMRYKVPVTLICDGVKKRVLVSLNDRSHMKFPVLLGRNYLEGDFLVDVEMDVE